MGTYDMEKEGKTCNINNSIDQLEDFASQVLLIELLNAKKPKFLRMSFFRVSEDIILRT